MKYIFISVILILIAIGFYYFITITTPQSVDGIWVTDGIIMTINGSSITWDAWDGYEHILQTGTMQQNQISVWPTTNTGAPTPPAIKITYKDKNTVSVQQLINGTNPGYPTYFKRFDPRRNLSNLITNGYNPTLNQRMNDVKLLCEKITGTPLAYCKKIGDPNSQDVYETNIYYFLKSVLVKKISPNYDLAALILTIGYSHVPMPTVFSSDSEGIVQMVKFPFPLLSIAKERISTFTIDQDNYNDPTWNNIRPFFRDYVKSYKSPSNVSTSSSDPISLDDFTNALNAGTLAEILGNRDVSFMSFKCDA
jgi:hypothetical protein